MNIMELDGGFSDEACLITVSDAGISDQSESMRVAALRSFSPAAELVLWIGFQEEIGFPNIQKKT